MLEQGFGYILGWSGLVLLGGLFLMNGIVMLISPRTWFRLPDWLAGRGSMTEEKYGTRNGHLQVRACGAIILAFISWIVVDALRKF